MGKVEMAIQEHKNEQATLAIEIASMTMQLDQKRERFLVVNNILSTFEFAASTKEKIEGKQ